ncbi:MAG: hypothetical protein Q8P41_14770, partial [Pseudomonadota bacterium]|nr:hypothetical protein [Pseudomonadota bacterium]
AALVRADAAPGGGVWGQRGRFDPSEYVQRATVDALATRLDEPEARAVLRALVDDPNAGPWARGAAGIVLARAARDGALPAAERDTDRARLATAAGSVSGGRGGALLLAAAIAGDTPARTRLAELLSAGNLPLELWFFRAMGESGVDTLAAPLAQALERVEPEIQLAVAAALLDLGAPAGERALTAALTADEERALEALEYLVDARGPAADGLLKAALAGPALVHDGAELALFGRGQGEVRDVVRMLGNEDAERRAWAAEAAGRRLRLEPGIDGGDRLRATLRDALPDADPTLQLALIEALAGSPVPEDRAALTTLLEDEAARVRVAAAAALAP